MTPPRPAGAARPVIIIFGAAVQPDGGPSGAMRHRVEAALATGRRVGPALYMPTGGQGRFGRPESAVMADLLAAAGIDPADIRQEPGAVNTLRSVLACAALLGRTRAPVYVASSRYHLARCVLLLRMAGLRARPGHIPTAPANRRWTQRWWWRIREVPAIPFDAATMMFYQLRMTTANTWRHRRGER